MSGALFITVVDPLELPMTLRVLRERHGLNVREAALAAGVGHNTFNRAERGKPIDVDTLVALTRFVKRHIPPDQQEAAT